MVNYSDECFVALHRVRTKQHLIVQEAIYILFDRPSPLCKQKPKLSLDLFGDISAWLGMVLIFSLPHFPFVWQSFFIFTSPPFTYSYLHCFKRLPKVVTWQILDKRLLAISIKFLHIVNLFLHVSRFLPL